MRLTNGTSDHHQVYYDCHTTPITSLVTAHLKKHRTHKFRATLVVLALDVEKLTFTIRVIFEIVMPRIKYIEFYETL